MSQNGGRRDYNPEEGRGRKNPASKKQAMKELLDVFVGDVELWFPPGKKTIVQHRSAWEFDFDVNRNRIKALRLAIREEEMGL